MNLLRLSWTNLWRRKLRSGLTLAGIAVATAALFSLLSFNRGFDRALTEEMDNSGIHMLVSTEGCPMEAASLALHGGEIPKFLDARRLPEIRDVPGVQTATGLLIFSLIEDEGRALYFYGVDEGYPALKPHWKIDGTWFTGPNDIVLGAEAALVEKRKVGDKVYFPELDADFTVSGIVQRTGSEDDGFFFLPLATAQRVFKKEGKLTGVAVHLEDLTAFDEVKGRIETLPDVYVVSRDQIMQQILSMTGSSKTLMAAVLIVALAVSVLGVLNTVLMSVFEMRSEFGYMRCVGASRGAIFRLVLIETLVLCLLGGIAGVILGLGLSAATDQWLHDLLPYAPAGRFIRFDPAVAGLSIAAAAMAGLLAGLLPSFKAAGASPMEAVRNG